MAEWCVPCVAPETAEPLRREPGPDIGFGSLIFTMERTSGISSSVEKRRARRGSVVVEMDVMLKGGNVVSRGER